MEITFNKVVVKVSTREVDGETQYRLTDVEAGWKELDGVGGELYDWKKTDDYKELIISREISLFNERGRNGGTWGDEEALYEYTSYCSKDFRRACRRAVIALSKGDVEEAQEAIGKVVIPQELVDRTKLAEKKLMNRIREKGKSGWFTGLRKPIYQFMTLACKGATGMTKKQIEPNKKNSLVTSLKKSGYQHALGAYCTNLEQIVLFFDTLQIDDYHKIAALLMVETEQNWKTLIAKRGAVPLQNNSNLANPITNPDCYVYCSVEDRAA